MHELIGIEPDRNCLSSDCKNSSLQQKTCFWGGRNERSILKMKGTSKFKKYVSAWCSN